MSQLLLMLLLGIGGPEVIKAALRYAQGDPNAELVKEQKKRSQKSYYAQKSAIASLTEAEDARQGVASLQGINQASEASNNLMEVITALGAHGGAALPGNQSGPREELDSALGEGFSQRVTDRMGFQRNPLLTAYGIPQEELL